MLLKSESVGEYKVILTICNKTGLYYFLKGFHIKYRIYGSSAEPAAKVAAKSTKKQPVKKSKPQVARSGRTQLSVKKVPKVAMKSAPIQPAGELGGIEKHIGLNIEMQGTWLLPYYSIVYINSNFYLWVEISTVDIVHVMT